jgi:hypothetical protein
MAAYGKGFGCRPGARNGLATISPLGTPAGTGSASIAMDKKGAGLWRTEVRATEV